jgi:hypothetical protein
LGAWRPPSADVCAFRRRSGAGGAPPARVPAQQRRARSPAGGRAGGAGGRGAAAGGRRRDENGDSSKAATRRGRAGGSGAAAGRTEGEGARTCVGCVASRRGARRGRYGQVAVLGCGGGEAPCPARPPVDALRARGGREGNEGHGLSRGYLGRRSAAGDPRSKSSGGSFATRPSNLGQDRGEPSPGLGYGVAPTPSSRVGRESCAVGWAACACGRRVAAAREV